MKGAVEVPIIKYSKATFTRILNDTGEFEIQIQDPTTQEMTDLVEDTEVKMDAWSTSLYGYIKNKQYSSQTKTLTIKGSDYWVLLRNVKIYLGNVLLADPALSSGYRVVYTSKAFNSIAGDILRTTGISAGTITNYGSIDIEFQNKGVEDGIKYLRDYAKYDCEVTTGKALNMVSRIGSATSVYQFDSSYNATITNWETDSQTGRVYKVVVLGSGTGAAQVVGTWTHASYSASDITKNKVRIFTDPSISKQAQATAVAANLGSFLNDSFLNASWSSADVMANVVIGDCVTLKDLKRGTGTLRITKITRTSMGDLDEVTFEGIDNTSKLRKAQFEDFLKKNSSLSEALGSVAQGQVKDFIWTGMGPASASNYLDMDMNVPTDGSPSILKAEVFIVRDNIDAPYGSQTGAKLAGFTQTSHPHNQQYFTQSAHPHTQNYFSQSNHTHTINAASTNTSIDGLSGIIEDYDTNIGTSTSSTTWVDIASCIWDPTSAEAIEGCAHIYMSGFAGAIAYVRLTDGSNYWPNSTGYPVYFGTDGGICLRAPSQWATSSGSYRIQMKCASVATKYYSGFIHAVKSHYHTTNAQTSVGNQATFTNPNSSANANANFTNANATVSKLANLTDNTHQNDLNVNILSYDDGLSHTIGVYVDGVFVSTITLAAVTDYSIVDLSSKITTAGVHTLELRPNGNVYLSAAVKVQAIVAQ